MVVVQLRPSIWSLVVTITSVLLELACLQGLFTLNAVLESRALRNGKVISVKRHRLRTRVLTILATLSFVGLEIVTSANSEGEIVRTEKSDSCIRLTERRRFETAASSLGDVVIANGAEAVGLSCVQVRKGRFFFRGGNYSVESGKVECDSDSLYSYTSNVREFLSPFATGVTSYCEQTACVSVILQGSKKLLLSEPYDSRSSRDKNASFTPTEVRRSIPRSQLRSIARQTLQIYRITLDELETRRLLLLQAREDSCLFENERRVVSRIEDWTFGLAVAFWGCCAVFFAGMCLVRRAVIYDMRDAMHWATRTRMRSSVDGDDESGVERRRAFVRLHSYDGSDATVQVLRDAT